jgi:hypothetical protein
MPAQIGDYVLATKYDDGDPCDQFAVGFFAGVTHHGRFLVVDDEGRDFRLTGFRRIEPITQDEGLALLRIMPDISDRPGPSLWDRLAAMRLRTSP